MYFNKYRNQREDASEAISPTFLGVQFYNVGPMPRHPLSLDALISKHGGFLSRCRLSPREQQDNLDQNMVAQKSTGTYL